MWRRTSTSRPRTMIDKVWPPQRSATVGSFFRGRRLRYPQRSRTLTQMAKSNAQSDGVTV